MRPSRLLFVVNVDSFFLSHRLPIALAAREAGFEVHVATELTGPAAAIESHGFTLHPLRVDRRSLGVWPALRLLVALLKIMRFVEPDVVHLVTIKPVLLGGLAARFSRVPRVVAAISGLGFVFTARGALARFRGTMVALLYRAALVRRGVYVVFQNASDQQVLQGLAGIRDTQVVRVLGSGVNLAEWVPQPLPQETPRVLMASRLLLDKGVLEFVQAARLLKAYRSVRFVLVGDVDPGNPTSLKAEDVRSWVREGVIEWWGHRRDMPQVLAMAHLVVLPSYREGLPKGLIEAAASGRAVVTTDVPGCRDAIDPGRTGLLVAVRSAPALAEGIQRLLDDPEKLKAMGLAGREWAERMFDVQEVVRRHLVLYGDASRP